MFRKRCESQMFSSRPLISEDEMAALQTRQSGNFTDYMKKQRAASSAHISLDTLQAPQLAPIKETTPQDQGNNAQEPKKPTRKLEQYRTTLMKARPIVGLNQIKSDMADKYQSVKGGMSRSISVPSLSRSSSKKISLGGSLAPRLHRETLKAMLNLDLSSQRNKVIKELLHTEADFIDDCDIVINIYMSTVQKSEILTDEQVDHIFTNILDIRYTHLEVLQELLRLIPSFTENPGVCPNIGEIFSNTARFQCYDAYLSRHDQSMKLLKEHITTKKDFHELLSTCAAHPETGKLDLASFLIKPIQRICKYPLLLRELVKSLPHADPQVMVCEKAIIDMEAFLASVNDRLKTHEKLEVIKKHLGKNDYVSLILEGRTIIKEGRLVRIKKEANEKYFWLLDNCLLWCNLNKKKKTSLIPKFQREKTNKRMIPLINIISVHSTETRTYHFTFSVMYSDDKGNQKSLLLSAESYLEKLLWVHTLERYL